MILDFDSQFLFDNVLISSFFTPSRQFPNCKFGSTCFFLHPPCKFDVNCAKIDCPYAHSVPLAARRKPIQTVQPISTAKPIQMIQAGKPKLLSTIQKIPPFIRKT